MDDLFSWAVPIGVAIGVVAFARWRQLRALAAGHGDLPVSPYFTIPDEPAIAGSRNARLVLTTWDLVKRNYAEATLTGAAIASTVTETSEYSGDVVRGGPYYQIFVLDEANASEARRILRVALAD